MPIQFRCTICNQRLSIAHRKIGTHIACPQCGYEQRVPSEDEALLAQLEPSPVHVTAEPQIETQRASKRRESKEVLHYTRNTLYTQAILFLVVAVASFLLGYYIGLGNAESIRSVNRQQANSQRVLLEGHLLYNPGTGRIIGDTGAVVVLLPSDAFPNRKFGIRGIRPEDSPGQSRVLIQAIESIGGIYIRTDAEGFFSLVVPKPGNYRLLLISHHAVRAEGITIDEADLAGLSEYFITPHHLIGNHKYRWSLEKIVNGRAPLEYDFGHSGKE